MTFGFPVEDFVTVRPGPRRRGFRGQKRPIPWWPLILIVAGTLVAGPIGLVVATSVAAALVVLRLRVITADPDGPDLPALPWPRQQHAPVLPGFTRTVGAVEWGLTSAFDFDTSLRPRLTRVAAVRLADRHGIDFVAQPRHAARMLGPEAWALLDPTRPLATDRSVRGPDQAALARVLDAIERI